MTLALNEMCWLQPSTATGADNKQAMAHVTSSDMWHDVFLRKMLPLSFPEVRSGTGCQAGEAQGSSVNRSTNGSAGGEGVRSSGLTARFSGPATGAGSRASAG